MAAASSTSILSPFFAGIMEEDQNHTEQIQYSSTTTPTSNATQPPRPPPQKKKRNPPGTPNVEAEIISLSPKSLMATNKFVCEVCNKGFQREQNLQLHRRGHNLPWKLKNKITKEETAAEDIPVKRKFYVCPEPTCIHHHPSRPLGDLTGIKKHFSRKHGEKKFKCDKCNKKYAVQSDWKAHSKACGTKEYKCGCGNVFNRRDSFITHRAFCEALAHEAAKHRPPAILNMIRSSHLLGTSSINLGLQQSDQILNDHHRPHDQPQIDMHNHLLPSSSVNNSSFAAQSQFPNQSAQQYQEQNNSALLASKSFQGFMQQLPDLQITNNNYPSNLFNLDLLSANYTSNVGNNFNNNMSIFMDFNNSTVTSSGGQEMSLLFNDNSIYQSQNSGSTTPPQYLSATALLQKATQIGSTTSNNDNAGSFARMENESQFQGLMDSFADAVGSTIARNTTSGGVNSQSFEHKLFNSLHQESDLPFGGAWDL